MAPAVTKLVDQYSRNLNYLRISITDRCNLKCLYCTPSGDLERISHDEILRYEEILRLVEIGTRLGISKVRVTGGEPLVRKGVYGFLERLARIEGLDDVSLTTNGVFLKDNIDRIMKAGIRRINISLDTLDRQKYYRITGADMFPQVWAGVKMVLENGFAPIKLNVVALKDVNEDELIDMARLSFNYPFHVRFIELMPFGSEHRKEDQRLLAPEIKERISALGDLEPVGKEINDGPAERFKFKGSAGEIGFIRPISRHFCATCNRLRLTADGQLRSCLLSDRQEDLKAPLRSAYTDNELAEIFLKAVKNKPSAHHLCGQQERLNGQMFAIGG
jgi:cyclic pyranopterin phosphate synthase